MDNKNKWNKLLSDKRFRNKSSSNSTDARNPFENDYGRLISSAPIRRLQDKTQVFPLEQSDYIRTRLTHSLEVSYIGSSIGESVEKILIEKGDIKKGKKGYLSSLLRVSGLVHDLGNPPFGHFGEEAIKTFFRDYFNSSEYKQYEKNIQEKTMRQSPILSDTERADFLNFDGNVQTFRILSKLYYFGDEYGYNLTYTTLSSCIKYPSSSLEGNKGKNAREIAKKKFGYFHTEKGKYRVISKYLGLKNRRSPIVYLMEAADDIAYSAADIEDSVKLNIVSLEDIKNIFKKKLRNNKNVVIKELDKLIKDHKKGKIDKSIAVQKFRILTQKIMIESVIKTFTGNEYDKIMKGELESEVIDISEANDVREAYKELQKQVFSNSNIIKKEVAGWEAIYGLLSIMVKASRSENFKAEGNTYESRIYKLISSSHRDVYEKIEKYHNKEYKKLQLIVDFISGMTDSYAITLYQELKGIKL